MNPTRATFISILLTLMISTEAFAMPIRTPEVQQFIDHMVKVHKFEEPQLIKLLAKARKQPAVLKAISNPAEALPWYRYRDLLITEARIQQGDQYWKHHQRDLNKANQQYGVPPEIIVAILGIESSYGQHTGRFPVIDALTTLAFYYPPRADFFRKELAQFLLLTRKEQLDPLGLKGSYAGALGSPQFIPSSYRHYAVDFNKDGQRNLLSGHQDAIGSIANYFKRHGWQQKQPIVTPAKVNNQGYQPFTKKAEKPHLSVAKFKRLGVLPTTTLPPDQQVSLLTLEHSPQQRQHWLALNNFYVITRYNHSPLYAMAVYKLSEALKQRHHAGVAAAHRLTATTASTTAQANNT